jgi:hypothetical protein
MRGCRDCDRCTESPLFTLLWLLPRIAGWLCGGFLVAMVARNCPQCAHRLTWHRQIKGRFAD